MNRSSAQFRIITGSYEHTLLCVSVNVPKDDKSSPIFQPIFHLEPHSLLIYCLNNSKRYLVSGSKDEHIRIYDLQKRKELGNLMGHQGSINVLQFSNNGKWLLSGSSDNSIIIWRVEDWEIFGRLKGHTEPVNDLAIHPSNKIAISCSNDNTLRLWNLMVQKRSAASILRLKYEDTNGENPLKIRWSADDSGKYFVVALLTKIMVFDTKTCKILKVMNFGIKSSVMHFEIFKNTEEEEEDQNLIVGLSNGKIQVFDLSKILNFKQKTVPNEEQKENKENVILASSIVPEYSLIGHVNRIKDFKIYKNNKGDASSTSYLVSISSDGKIVVWDLFKKDQVAVYDTGERLNCVTLVSESIEKANTMKKRELDAEDDYKTESEYETDGEGSKKILFGNNKNKKSKQRKKARKQGGEKQNNANSAKAFVEIE